MIWSGMSAVRRMSVCVALVNSVKSTFSGGVCGVVAGIWMGKMKKRCPPSMWRMVYSIFCALQNSANVHSNMVSRWCFIRLINMVGRNGNVLVFENQEAEYSDFTSTQPLGIMGDYSP